MKYSHTPIKDDSWESQWVNIKSNWDILAENYGQTTPKFARTVSGLQLDRKDRAEMLEIASSSPSAKSKGQILYEVLLTANYRMNWDEPKFNLSQYVDAYKKLLANPKKTKEYEDKLRKAEDELIDKFFPADRTYERHMVRDDNINWKTLIAVRDRCNSYSIDTPFTIYNTLISGAVNEKGKPKTSDDLEILLTEVQDTLTKLKDEFNDEVNYKAKKEKEWVKIVKDRKKKRGQTIEALVEKFKGTNETMQLK